MKKNRMKRHPALLNTILSDNYQLYILFLYQSRKEEVTKERTSCATILRHSSTIVQFLIMDSQTSLR